MLVLSDTLSALLWVVIAKAALLRSLLYINVARKLAAEHSMRWQQFFLRYFLTFILPVCSRWTSLSVELPRRLLWMIEYTFDLYFVCPRRHLSSDHLPLAFYLWDFELNSLTIVHSFLDQSMSSDKVQGPIYNFGPLPLQKL